ncbi:MAG: MATE family efflux transporter [Pseudohongiellaceae bacterium]
MSLTEGPVRDKLFRLWLPMIGGVLAVKAIDISDAYFVGQLGSDSLAAISFTFPVVMTLISLSIGLSSGASSVLSRAIGAGAGQDRQQGIVAGTVGLATLISIVLAIVGFLIIEPLFRLLGAEPELMPDIVGFMRIWFAGSLFLILPIAVTGLIRATGDGATPAILMAFIAVLNIGLNPVFIFGLGPVPALGMEGAAVATVIARALATILACQMLWKRGLLDLSLEPLRRGVRQWREISVIGLPASLSTSLNPVALAIATAAVATLGTDQVAAFGVVTKIEAFAVVPLLALSSASAPFVGQNSGGGNEERSREALLWCCGIAGVWTVFIVVVLALVARPLLLPAFTDSGDVIAFGALYLMIVPWTFAGYGITVALSAGMNGLGRSITALCISGGRAIGLLAPLAWLGVLFGDFIGVAAGVATANVIAGLVSVVVIFRHNLQVREKEYSAKTESTGKSGQSAASGNAA